MEEWRDAVGFEGLYEVSNFGKVRRKTDGQELKGGPNSYGYWVFGLSRGRERKMAKGHRLVAEAFIPNPDNKRSVNHKDGDRTNNFVDNLEWASTSANLAHAREVLKVDFSVKPVVQITLSGEVIAVWINATFAAKSVGVSAQMIGACCRGSAPTAGGFTWSFADSPTFSRIVKEAQAEGLRRKIAQLSSGLSELEEELA